MAYELGGKCLAYHGPMLYEAKILRVWDPSTGKYKYETKPDIKTQKVERLETEGDPEDRPPSALAAAECFFVHYRGWKSTWDEWIAPERMREYTEENIAERKKMLQQAREAKRAATQERKKPGPRGRRKQSAAGEFPDSSVSSPGPNSTESAIASIGSGFPAKFENSNEPMLPTLAQPTARNIVLHVPTKLKGVLVDDWEYVTKDKMVCQLPAKVTVHQLFAQFEHDLSLTLETVGQQSQLSEYVAGMREYFRHALPRRLLYRLERLQFADLLKAHQSKTDKPHGDDMDPTHVYGCIHLLRLTTLLPDMISATTMDPQSCLVIIRHTERLLVWMLERWQFALLQDTYASLQDQYENTSSQYEGVALNM